MLEFLQLNPVIEIFLWLQWDTLQSIIRFILELEIYEIELFRHKASVNKYQHVQQIKPGNRITTFQGIEEIYRKLLLSL